MNFKGQHIPKATMAAYLRQKFGKSKISTQLIDGVLHLSNAYISKLSTQANDICTAQNKKTINIDHLYKAIEHYQLKDHIEELKKVQTQVKEVVAHKHEIKQKIQKSYEDMVKQGRGVELRRDTSIMDLKREVCGDLFKNDGDQSDDYENEDQEEEQEEKPVPKQPSPSPQENEV